MRFAKNALECFLRLVEPYSFGEHLVLEFPSLRRSIYDVATLIIALVSLVILIRWKVSEPILIACAAAAGLLRAA